ncbi:hypothetical protein ACTWJ8_34200 [Streptomyces sp. SDT5-1]|uniref:hypothetical protein n=1 Tax=Streptomyces sp. SDT5-1 TaxID=3406418 RepID=UPI003FD0AFAA
MKTTHVNTHVNTQAGARVLTARRAATALACAAALLSLTACNDGDKADGASDSKASTAADKPAQADAKPNGAEKLSAVELRTKGMETKAAAGSVHEVMSRSDAKSDLRLSATECVGKVELIGMGGFDVIRKGDDVWGKVDAKFASWLKKNGSTVPADQWMHGSPTDGATKVFASYCHGEQFGKQEKSSLKFTKGADGEVDGQPVATVVAKGTAPGKQATYSIATTGKPYLLKQVAPYSNGTGDQTITWSDFGTPVSAKAPSGKVVKAPQI